MEPDDQDDDGGRRKAMLALGIIVALAIVSLLLIRYLKNEGEVEDCLMAHGSNCDALTSH